MKNLVALFLISCSLFSYAQELKFVPKWKQGDKFKVLTKTKTKSLKKDTTWKVEKRSFESELYVKSIRSDHFLIQITYKNFYLTMFKKAFENIDEQPPTISKLKLLFKVKKDGSNASLEKWKEIRDLVNDQVKLVIQKSASKKGEGKEYIDSLNLMFSSITEVWNSKESIESMFDFEIEAFLAPFKTSFSKDTITTKIKVMNPFAKEKKDSIECQHLSWLSSKKGKLYDLGNTNIMDMSDYSELIKEMMKGMFSGFLKMAGDSTSEKYLKGKQKLDDMLDKIKFDIKEVNNFNYNAKTGYILFYKKTSSNEGSMMGKPIKTEGWREVIFTKRL